MRILQIAPQIPYPLDNGARLGIYRITEALVRRGHDVDLVCFGRTGDAADAMNQLCAVHTVDVETRNRAWPMLAKLASSKPYTHVKYDSPRFADELNRLVQAKRPDAVHIDSLHMSWYVPILRKLVDAPIFLRAHNVEHVIWDRYVETERRPWRRVYARLQAKRVREFERQSIAEYDGVLAISPGDADRLRRLQPTARVHLVPAGVERRDPLPPAPVSGRHDIVFVGSLDWFPNSEGISWFARSVFPLVRKDCPTARLIIVGSRPSAEVMRLAGEDVEIHANVPSVEEFYARASCVVVPLRVGGGVRLKILEALALKRPVVSTTVGYEGLHLTPGEDLLVADSPENLATAILQVLNDRSLAARLAGAGHGKVTALYSWDRIASQLEAIYQSGR